MPTKIQYERMRLTGKCLRPKCDEDAVDGKTQCRTHLDDSAQSIQSKRNANKLAGLCATCGKVPPERKLTRCRRCIDQAAISDLRNRAERKRHRLCRRCKNKSLRGHVFCRKCLNKANGYGRARDQRARLERYSKGLCVKCGERPPRDIDVVSCRICLAQAMAYYDLKKEIREYEQQRTKRRAVKNQAAQNVHASP